MLTNLGKYISILMMVESAITGCAYLWQRDIRHGVYWLAVAVITAAVTF